MLHFRHLKSQLQNRISRLLGTTHEGYEAELSYFVQYLRNTPYLHALLTTIDAGTSVDFQEWKANFRSGRNPEYPATEAGRAKIFHCIIEQCVVDETGGAFRTWMTHYGSSNSYDKMVRDFTEKVVAPLVNFLFDQIEEGGNVLYLIERFKLKAEWFRQEELFYLYKGDTSVGETRLDQELRASLFDGGVDYPFSQPSSPSGKADVVAMLGSEDPLVLEVKVFDPDLNKGVGNLRQGFHQILRYADDYNQPVGYLVIFNCSNRQLVISPQNESDTAFPPRVTFGGKTFFVIPIDISPGTASASKERPSTRQVISLDNLIGSNSDAVDGSPSDMNPATEL